MGKKNNRNLESIVVFINYYVTKENTTVTGIFLSDLADLSLPVYQPYPIKI
jgi:hypothetical protein|tara:strand:+ start:324 stop:476 length:153 start_codon:yes stop_codon:yes gene_type:complete